MFARLKRVVIGLNADRYDVGYILSVVIAAVLDLKFGAGAITSAGLSTGVMLLMTGLGIRYVFSEPWRSSRLFVIPWRYAQVLSALNPELRPREPDHVHNGEHIRLPDGLLSVIDQALPLRNVKRYGLVLIAGGICLTLGSPVSAVAATVFGFIGLTWAQDRRERSLPKRWANDPQSHAVRSLMIHRSSERAVVAPLSTNVILAIATLVVYAAIARNHARVGLRGRSK